MSRDELLALAERVEKATGAGPAEVRDLILEAWETVNGDRDTYQNMVTAAERSEYLNGCGHIHRLLGEHAFLDAAMTLVPEGWTYSAYQGPSGQPHKWALRTIRDGDQRYTEVEAKAHTPALALTTAALRALAQTQPDNSND